MKYLKINLLPYREELLRKQKKESLIFLLVVFISCLFVAFILLFILKFINFSINNKIDYLKNEMKFNNSAIKNYNNEIKRHKKLLISKQSVEKIQYDRYLSLRLLIDLNNIMPKGLYLKSIIYQSDENYIVTGRALNENQLSLFIKSIPSSIFFETSNLIELKMVNESVKDFSLSLKLIKNNNNQNQEKDNKKINNRKSLKK